MCAPRVLGAVWAGAATQIIRAKARTTVLTMSASLVRGDAGGGLVAQPRHARLSISAFLGSARPAHGAVRIGVARPVPRVKEISCVQTEFAPSVLGGVWAGPAVPLRHVMTRMSVGLMACASLALGDVWDGHALRPRRARLGTLALEGHAKWLKILDGSRTVVYFPDDRIEITHVECL